MCVLEEYDDYRPICDECGIALCYTLTLFEYIEHKDYWDNWCCKDCDPDYFKKWSIQHRKEHLLEMK